MTPRIHIDKDAAAAYQALYNVTNVLEGASLPKTLKHLVDLRVSQLNGCAFCIKLHQDWGRRDGETDRRLAAVADWRRSPLFSAAEKAALEWAEVLTERQVHDLDRLHAALKDHFDARAVAELTMMVATINAWNRIGIACWPEA